MPIKPPSSQSSPPREPEIPYDLRKNDDRRLAEILQGMTEACFVLDQEWNFTFINDRGTILLRHRGEALLGRSIWEVFEKLVGTPMEVYYRRAMSQRAAAAFEVYSPIAERWLDIRLFPSGSGLAAFLLDVSERKKREEEVCRLNLELERRVVERTAQLEEANTELRHSREELSSLFECLPGLYLILTPELKIVAASDAYLKATMTTREGILGRDLFEIFPDNPDDPATKAESSLRASINRVLSHGTPDTMAIQRYDVRRPDGVFEERYWSPINSPAFGVDRRIKYVVHRVEEVTDFVTQKSRAAGGHELRGQMAMMEAEVYQSSQKVRAANEQLEAANKELESFSYSVSHDLRSPLRGINSFVRMIQDDYAARLDAEGNRMLDVVSSEAKRMGQLIDDLLAFSQVGRQRMESTVVNMGALARAAFEAVVAAMPASAAARFELGSLPVARGDPALLRQVFVNLIGNAVKYSGKQPAPFIEVGGSSRAGELTYYVKDNGVGFEEKYSHKLFGVFQRLHSEAEFEGTGVGLAIVQRVIHRHGGTVRAEAKPGKGATFYFTLPSPPALAP
jgi:signal transduction histidine kinase